MRSYVVVATHTWHKNSQLTTRLLANLGSRAD